MNWNNILERMLKTFFEGFISVFSLDAFMSTDFNGQKTILLSCAVGGAGAVISLIINLIQEKIGGCTNGRKDESSVKGRNENSDSEAEPKVNGDRDSE